MGDLSQDFSRKEFACRDGCGRDRVRGGLVEVLQRARSAAGRPLNIVSGVRCEARNRAVGGSPGSQHLFGRAADVPRGFRTAREWIAHGAIGVGVRDGRVVHVDVRPGRQPFVFDD